jgi:two-component system response regulator AtoC
VRLGDASGMDVLQKIKEIDKDIKVIMVTALSDEESTREAESKGADGYIVKPFTAGYLDEIILENIADLGLRKKENK